MKIFRNLIKIYTLRKLTHKLSKTPFEETGGKWLYSAENSTKFMI